MCVCVSRSVSPSPPAAPPDLFADVYLSPQVGTVTPPRCHPQGTQLSPQALAAAPQVAGADGILVTPGVAMGTGGAQQGQRGSPRHPKKKCVNGFIMFCCLNRKAYMRWGPQGQRGGARGHWGHGDLSEGGDYGETGTAGGDVGTPGGTWAPGGELGTPGTLGTWGQQGGWGHGDRRGDMWTPGRLGTWGPRGGT